MTVKKASTKATPPPKPTPRQRAAKATVVLPAKVVISRSIDGTNPLQPGQREHVLTLDYAEAAGAYLPELIQRTAGPGAYRIEFRNEQGRMFGAADVDPNGDSLQPQAIYIADARMPDLSGMADSFPTGAEQGSVTEIAAALLQAQKQARLPASNPLAQVGALREMLTVARELQPPAKTLVEQVQEARALLAAIAPPAQPTAPPAPPDPTVTVIKMLMENPNSMKQLRSQVSALFTGEIPEPKEPARSFWEELGLQAVTALMPQLGAALAPAIPDLLAKLSGNNQPPQGSAAETPASAQAAPSQAAPPQTAQPAQRLTPSEALLCNLLNACQQQADPQAMADYVVNFQAQYPQTEAFVDGFINLPADLALRVLAQHLPEAAAIVTLPHVTAWTQAVQDALTTEGAGEGAESPTTAPNQAGLDAGQVPVRDNGQSEAVSA